MHVGTPAPVKNHVYRVGIISVGVDQLLEHHEGVIERGTGLRRSFDGRRVRECGRNDRGHARGGVRDPLRRGPAFALAPIKSGWHQVCQDSEPLTLGLNTRGRRLANKPTGEALSIEQPT